MDIESTTSCFSCCVCETVSPQLPGKKRVNDLNNDHSHRVFIYVLKRRLCSHFPALSPCSDDKVGKA